MTDHEAVVEGVEAYHPPWVTDPAWTRPGWKVVCPVCGDAGPRGNESYAYGRRQDARRAATLHRRRYP